MRRAKGQGRGLLTCLDLTGKRRYQVDYGPEWDGTGKWVYPGAHSTPTVVGDRLYLVSGYGVLQCRNTADGALVWSVDLLKTFEAENIRWGISESPLVDGDDVYATPGGALGTVVKLDRHTGKTRWAAKLDAASAYCSPALVRVGTGRVLVTMTADGVVGLDPATGALHWDVQFSNEAVIHPNTPVLAPGGILVCAIGGEGVLAIKLTDGGRKASDAWDADAMDTEHGGLVVLGGRVYGTSYRRPKARLQCLDATTGKLLGESRVVGKASLVTAEGLLYCYGHSGTLALVAPTPDGFETRGTLAVTEGSGEHWAHPAIAGGVLYVRRGTHLVAYAIRRQ